MVNKRHLLKTSVINQLFIDGLSDAVSFIGNKDEKPFLVDLKIPYKLKLRIYLYNCTNPPGGRSLEEYKIQVILPNQLRGTRGNFDYSDGRLPVVGAYVKLSSIDNEGVFVLWDAIMHDSISYSANFQVKTETIIDALCTKVAEGKRGNNEIVIAARPKYLLEAIERRIDIMIQNI